MLYLPCKFIIVLFKIGDTMRNYSLNTGGGELLYKVNPKLNKEIRSKYWGQVSALKHLMSVIDRNSDCFNLALLVFYDGEDFSVCCVDCTKGSDTPFLIRLNFGKINEEGEAFINVNFDLDDYFPSKKCTVSGIKELERLILSSSANELSILQKPEKESFKNRIYYLDTIHFILERLGLVEAA